MNYVERTYLWWRLSGIPPRASLCHVAELHANSAFWHLSPWTIGFFGSRRQTYMRHFLASMVERFDCWDQYETMAWLLPIYQNTPSKCWPWYCRWLRTRVGGILEDLCISILIYLRLNIQSKDVCILVNIDSSLVCHFDYRSDSHPKILTRKAVSSADNFGVTVWVAVKEILGKGWRKYTQVFPHV